MLLILKDKKKSVAGTEKTIKILEHKLTKKNVPTDVASLEDIELFIETNAVRAIVKDKPLDDYDMIYFRRVGEKRNLAYIISKIAEKKNIFFLDKIYSATNEPSKLKQMMSLAIAGISVPKTCFSSFYTKNSIEKAAHFISFPMVIKLSRSKKGLGVFLAKNKKEALEIIAKNPEEEIFIQEFIPNSFDYRVLVLGNKIGCVIKRERTDKDNEFRNNVSLGASEEFLDLQKANANLKKTALKAAKVANIQIAGVDIVIDKNGKNYIFEVNRSPAFTYDAKVSNEINCLAQYISECHSQEKK